MSQGRLCFLFCIAMSSSIDVVLKLASVRIEPLQMAFWRFLLGGLACLPAALGAASRLRIRFSPATLLPLAGSGFLCVVLSTGLYQTAITMGKASVLSVLYCCNPLFVAAAARLILGERVSRRGMCSGLLYVAGMAAILIGRSEGSSMLSCALTLAASALFAVYNVLGQRWIGRYPPVFYVTFSFLFGAAELLAVIGLSYLGPWAGAAQDLGLDLLVRVPLIRNLDAGAVPTLLYLGVVATGLNYLALQIATRELSAIAASLIFYFKLILAPLLAWAVLREEIHWEVRAAIVLIFAALLVSFSEKKPVRPGHDAA